MNKEYQWQLKNKITQLQNRDRKAATFLFTDKQTNETHKILVEISGPRLLTWECHYEKTYGEPLDIKKLLCWIAKEDGLKKGIKKSYISTNNYPNFPCSPEDINTITDNTCIVEFKNKPFGFYSKKDNK